MNIKEVERVVTGLQSKLFKNANSYSIGVFKSQFKGSGLQFKEHLIYNHGDDVRFIDWSQSAKSQRTYVKTFEEERNVEVHTVLDITPSMLLGFRNKTKFQAMIELMALIYLVTGKTQDYATAHLWSHKSRIIPKVSGRAGIIQLMSVLKRQKILLEDGQFNKDYQFEHDLDEEKKINWLKSMVVRKKEVILLSDFSNMNQKTKWIQILKSPYIHAFQILSPLELMESKRHFFQSISGWGTLNTEKLAQKNWGKRVKTLRVDEKYLDLFVKEMILK